MFFYNYFSGYLLFEDLTVKLMYSIGTVGPDRFQRSYTPDKIFSKQKIESRLNDKITIQSVSVPII